MDFNPFDPAFRADPYPVYAQLREAGPIQQSAMNFWPVSRYDDVSFVLKNHALFSSSSTMSQIAWVPTRLTSPIQ